MDVSSTHVTEELTSIDRHPNEHGKTIKMMLESQESLSRSTSSQNLNTKGSDDSCMRKESRRSSGLLRSCQQNESSMESTTTQSHILDEVALHGDNTTAGQEMNEKENSSTNKTRRKERRRPTYLLNKTDEDAVDWDDDKVLEPDHADKYSLKSLLVRQLHVSLYALPMMVGSLVLGFTAVSLKGSLEYQIVNASSFDLLGKHVQFNEEACEEDNWSDLFNKFDVYFDYILVVFAFNLVGQSIKLVLGRPNMKRAILEMLCMTLMWSIMIPISYAQDWNFFVTIFGAFLVLLAPNLVFIVLRRSQAGMKKMVVSIIKVLLYEITIFAYGVSCALFITAAIRITEARAQVFFMGFAYPLVVLVLRRVIQRSLGQLTKRSADYRLIGTSSLILEVIMGLPGMVSLYYVANERTFYVSIIVSMIVELGVMVIAFKLGFETIKMLRTQSTVSVAPETTNAFSGIFSASMWNSIAIRFLFDQVGEKLVIIVAWFYIVYVRFNVASFPLLFVRLMYAYFMDMITDIAKDFISAQFGIHTAKIPLRKFKYSNLVCVLAVAGTVALCNVGFSCICYM